MSRLEPEIHTARLLLRRWREADLEPFARINADPQVCAFLAAPMTRSQSDVLVQRVMAHFQVYRFGLWAVEIPGVTPFAGFVGLQHLSFQTAFTPAVEIAWRLGSEWWGRGYAREAALACRNYAFDDLALTGIVAFCVRENRRSIALMEAIGLRHDEQGDFDHPRLPPTHPHRRHVLYRMNADDYQVLPKD